VQHSVTLSIPSSITRFAKYKIIKKSTSLSRMTHKKGSISVKKTTYYYYRRLQKNLPKSIEPERISIQLLQRVGFERHNERSSLLAKFFSFVVISTVNNLIWVTFLVCATLKCVQCSSRQRFFGSSISGRCSSLWIYNYENICQLTQCDYVLSHFWILLYDHLNKNTNSLQLLFYSSVARGWYAFLHRRLWRHCPKQI
jgi:hypothetical protein